MTTKKHLAAVLNACLFFWVSVQVLPAMAQDSGFKPADICPAEVIIDGMTVPVTAYDGDGLTDGKKTEWAICVPEIWNGDLVVYAHGTVSALAEGGQMETILAQLQFDGASIPELANSQGFAFAVAARSKSGLSVVEGIQELPALYDKFTDTVGIPNHAFIIGTSQGSAIATLLVEAMGDSRFQGAIAACGPIGSFRRQLSYFLDFLVLFEYYFRDQLDQTGLTLLEDDDGNPHVPQALLDDWETNKDVIAAILQEAPLAKLDELLRVARVPRDPSGNVNAREIAADLLLHIVPNVNDAVATLGGNPYDNSRRFYWGARNPFRLNREVLRFSADPEALEELQANYETTGDLLGQLVSLHNLWDPRVPFWHEALYTLKVLKQDQILKFAPIPIARFGHCAFTPEEALNAFALLVRKSTADFTSSNFGR